MLGSMSSTLLILGSAVTFIAAVYALVIGSVTTAVIALALCICGLAVLVRSGKQNNQEKGQSH